MICRTVWHPATRPRCIVRPSVAAQRPSARATSPPRDAQRFRLTPWLRARTYNVSPLVRSWTSCSEKPADCPEKPAELHPAIVVRRVRRRTERIRGGLLGAVAMMGLPLRETPSTSRVHDTLPSTTRPSGYCDLTRGFASPPRGGFALIGKGSLPLLLSRERGNSCARADQGSPQRIRA